MRRFWDIRMNVTKPESVTILLPLPDSWLSPNRPPFTPGGRIRKAVETKRYRKIAREAVEAIGIESGPWAKSRATLVFYWPRNNRRDLRNAESSMKAAYDGVVDAGLIVDDDAKHLEHGPTRFECDRESPRVELTIERLPDG